MPQMLSVMCRFSDVPADQAASWHITALGALKNTDGLLWEFFSKGTDFGKVTDKEVQHAVELICDRPRKILEHKTTNEVYREMLHSA